MSKLLCEKVPLLGFARSAILGSAQKLFVERSRDEKSSLYNHHPSASLGVQEPRRGDITIAPSGRHPTSPHRGDITIAPSGRHHHNIKKYIQIEESQASWVFHQLLWSMFCLHISARDLICR